MAKRNEDFSYKQLVKEAKKRLLNNSYHDILKVNKIGITGKSYLVNSEWVTGEELYNYYERIAKMQESNEVGGALGALIDDEVYDSLSPAARERYVLSISQIYRDLKKEFEKQAKKLNNV